MERKPLEVEPSTTTTNTDVVDSFEEEQRKIVYRGWKVMPFIIGNAPFYLFVSNSDIIFFFWGALSDFREV